MIKVINLFYSCSLLENIKCGDVIIDRGHYMSHVGAINGKNVTVVSREE